MMNTHVDQCRSTARTTLLFLGASLLAACGGDADSTATEQADALYFNGSIITMDGETPTYVEALAVKDGKILFVGDQAEAMAMKGEGTEMNDLQGSTLLPGFIDPHSHFINSLSMSDQANCSAPPVGPAKDPASIVAALKAFADEHGKQPGDLIMGYGYDDTQMPERNLLDRDDLDAVFPDNPVMVMHVSLHGAVLNSKAMSQYGISSATETPPGGIIVRKPGTNEPHGLIMETAFLPIFGQLPKPTPEQQKAQVRAGQMIYAEAGLTTAQEGASHMHDIEILQQAAKDGELFIDVVSYPFITELDELLKHYSAADFGTYNNRLKLGGIKITIDGSPQGRTALFTTPYLTGGPSGETDWRGEPTFPQEMANEMLKRVYDMGVQATFHANGDGAIDMCIEADRYASGGDHTKDRRTTVIHSQFVRPDQLDTYVEQNIMASFYTEHTFFFADAHIRNRGPEQAAYLSPMRDAIDKGVPVTNHTDFNVAPIDQLLVVWSAVNRVSRDGASIGPEQRITPYEALQAITSWAAYQYFEEDRKGRLKPGLLADLVILDKDPLKVAPMTIRDIQVMRTVKEGKTIYARN